jgi:hypothetical protein
VWRLLRSSARHGSKWRLEKWRLAMAQGEFTKEECDATEEAVKEIMEGISKPKQSEFLGHFNDIFLFIRAAKAVAPNEKK